MPVTMSRLNLIKGLGPALQFVEFDVSTHDILDKRTEPAWSTTWFVQNLNGSGAFKNEYDVMNSWGANHAVVSYGHIGADLITLASILRIPVCMHNVDKFRIYRSSAWNAFGTSEPEGTDSGHVKTSDHYMAKKLNISKYMK